jgi:cysteine desulfurase/selenocysteine lyase
MNFADAVGLGAAIDYLAPLGMDAVHEHGRELAVRAIRGLSSVPGVTVFGPPPEEDRGGIVSFVVDGVHAHDVAAVLDREGLALRAGHHCAMPLHQRLGVPATTRASFTVYNDASEVDRLVEGVQKVKTVFSRWVSTTSIARTSSTTIRTRATGAPSSVRTSAPRTRTRSAATRSAWISS